LSASRSRFVLGAVAVGAVVLASRGDVRAQQDNRRAQFEALGWREGPTSGDLGPRANVSVPDGFRFVGHTGASKFMELTENPSDGDELGVLLHDDSWFVVFTFDESGYVKDDDKNNLEADKILSSIKKGTEQANKVRAQRGWSTMEILGWQQAPFYDPGSHNLTWSIRGRSEGDTSINHSVRLLGRHGVMHVDLVAASDEMGEALPVFNDMLRGFSFKDGQRYAEFKPGDRIAQYGLTGLIVGGTGAALIKTGLLQKFWKLIVVAFIAVAGFVKRLFTGERSEPVQESPRV
jgi:uncharacterized membrane-anchored protein